MRTILGEKNLGSVALFFEMPLPILKIPWVGLTMQFLLLRKLSPIWRKAAEIGMLLCVSGKAQEANLRRSYGDGHFSLALLLNHLAVAHVELEDPAKAVELFEESKGILTKTPQ